jgi:hypothetical protein
VALHNTVSSPFSSSFLSFSFTPIAPFLKYGTQKCASDASAVSASDPTPRVLLDGCVAW